MEPVSGRSFARRDMLEETLAFTDTQYLGDSSHLGPRLTLPSFRGGLEGMTEFMRIELLLIE